MFLVKVCVYFLFFYFLFLVIIVNNVGSCSIVTPLTKGILTKFAHSWQLCLHTSAHVKNIYTTGLHFPISNKPLSPFHIVWMNRTILIMFNFSRLPFVERESSTTWNVHLISDVCLSVTTFWSKAKQNVYLIHFSTNCSQILQTTSPNLVEWSRTKKKQAKPDQSKLNQTKPYFI